MPLFHQPRYVLSFELRISQGHINSADRNWPRKENTMLRRLIDRFHWRSWDDAFLYFTVLLIWMLTGLKILESFL